MPHWKHASILTSNSRLREIQKYEPNAVRQDKITFFVVVAADTPILKNHDNNVDLRFAGLDVTSMRCRLHVELMKVKPCREIFNIMRGAGWYKRQ